MLASRLKSEREKLGMNKKEVSEQLGIPYTTYCNYEAGSREPNSEMLKKIANYYSVTLDYLLGLSDLANSSLQQETSKRSLELGDRIRQLRDQLGLTQEDVAKRVGVAIQTIYKYENGIVTNIPSDKIENIAKALETTPAYLMGWEPDPSSEESNTSPVSSFLAKKKVIADIKSSATNTYTIHGSQGKGSVVKSSIPKDKGVLAYNEKIYELTQAEFTALEGVIKAMRNEIRD